MPLITTDTAMLCVIILGVASADIMNKPIWVVVIMLCIVNLNVVMLSVVVPVN